MNRLRLATSAMLAGVVLSAGCASPCGGGGIFHRMSMFRARAAAPCECCSNCSGGPPTACGASLASEGPLLESPPGGSMTSVPPPPGSEVPAPFPTPLGPPSVPPEPGRISPTPLPNAAQPMPTQPSARVRR